MKNIRFWEAQYTRFINKVLGNQKRMYEQLASETEKEMEYWIREREEKLRTNPDRMVVFLYINHMLNKLDPIGDCYPGSFTEYADDAWEITGYFFEGSREELETNTLNKIEEVISNLSTNPKGLWGVKWNTTDKILKKTDKLRGAKNWKLHYLRFVEDILGDQKRTYEDMAACVEEEIQLTIESRSGNKSTEKDLKDLEQEVLFLHINHELNKVDPIGVCYPGIFNEYASYAEKITEFYLNSSIDEFTLSTTGMIEGIWWSIGSNPEREENRQQTEEIVCNIINLITRLYGPVKMRHMKK